MSDIDTVVMDSLKVLDPNRPIREADIVATSSPLKNLKIEALLSVEGPCLS